MPTNSKRRTPRIEKPGHTKRIGSGLAAIAAGAGLLATAAPAAADVPAQIPLQQLGSSGSIVKDVQRDLHIHTTGHYDAATKRAVMTYQHEQGLLVDGIVGPQTWDSLNHIKAAPASSSTTSTTGSGSSGYSIPASIVNCESGGNYSAVNSSSGAGGAYQILPSTWAAYGGQGLPQDAPPAEQDHIAAEIYANQGPGAWVC